MEQPIVDRSRALALDDFTGSSLRPEGKPARQNLNPGGFDRSWASSLDEAFEERLRLTFQPKP